MKKKLLYFENLRVLAILTVIITHVISPLFFISSPHFNSPWWIANVLHALFRFAVPVMFMQSGALLLNPSRVESLKDFFKNRFSKILLPFLSWNVLYASIVAITAGTSIPFFLLKSLEGSIFYHLWFVYVLFGLYLITPILRIYIKNTTSRNLAYFLVLWFFITGINPLLKKLVGYDIEIKIEYLYGYIGYFVLGYFLNTTPFPKSARLLSYAAGVASFIIIVFATYFLSLQTKKPDFFFHEYLSIPVMLMSIAAFIAARHSPILNSFDVSLKGRLHIGRICYGVYLSHALILAILKYRLGIHAATDKPIEGIIITTLITYILCFGFFIFLDLFHNAFITKLSRFIY